MKVFCFKSWTDAFEKTLHLYTLDPLKMYFLLKMGIFHCYVTLPEVRCFSLKRGTTSVVPMSDV